MTKEQEATLAVHGHLRVVGDTERGSLIVEGEDRRTYRLAPDGQLYQTGRAVIRFTEVGGIGAQPSDT